MYMMHPIEIELTQVSKNGIISIITIEALQVAMGRNSISAITSEHMNSYVFNSDSMLWVSELTGEQYFAIDVHSSLPVVSELEPL